MYDFSPSMYDFFRPQQPFELKLHTRKFAILLLLKCYRMTVYRFSLYVSLAFGLASIFACNEKNEPAPIQGKDTVEYFFGADLSYVNQVLDHGGKFRLEGSEVDPYQLFADRKTNLARFRLWHNPAWTKTVYGESGTQLYNDLADVEKSISKARSNGMKVLLDFHYSDTWADPGKQYIPDAWIDIREISVLKDSIYNYTFKTLTRLNDQGLMPDFVQIGNETNCGMLFSSAPDGFPSANICNGEWGNFSQVLKAAIKAVRDASAISSVKTKIALHVADPKNVDWFFSNLIHNLSVTDFDIIGFSYYPLWHTTVGLSEISDKIATFKSTYGKDVMIMETAYPWTTDGADDYNNLLGGTPLAAFPFTPEGQYNFLVKLTQEVKAGEGIGVIYWEPAWISSSMKDPWGTGSAWENATFFDFSGNTIKGIDYTQYTY
jgi:arabinogalactan endo-1,4-beta-galactosidase